MSTNKNSSALHGYPNSSDFGISVAELVSNSEDPLQSPDRYKCRILGHESDTTNIPDENLMFYTACKSGFSSHRGKGKNSKYLPGDKVLIVNIGNERFILGSIPNVDPKEGEEADSNPYTQGFSNSPKSPPASNESRTTGWNKYPSDKTTTQEIREAILQRKESFKEKGENKSRNKYNRTAARFKDGDFLSIASEIPFDNTQNPMKFIKEKINNKGSVMPSMLDMVEKLRTLPNDANPHAIQSVGAGNYVSFLSEFGKFFKDLIKSTKQNAKDAKEQEKEEARLQAQLEKALQYASEE